MHPYISDEIARQRRRQLEGEAAVHRRHRTTGHDRGSPSTDRGRITAVSGHADAGIRQQLGLALIRAGMRIVDPQTAIPSRSR